MPTDHRPQATDVSHRDALTMPPVERSRTGLGEILAALVLLGSLLAVAWIVAAAGLLDREATPVSPDDLDVSSDRGGEVRNDAP